MIPNQKSHSFLLAFLISLFFTSLSFAQTQSSVVVIGKITDAENGEPLSGVSIVVKGTVRGTITNIDGVYTITTKDRDILVFSFIGYTSQEVLVGDKTKIDIALTSADSKLDNLIVVGYGVQKKSQIASAIATISEKDFRDQPVSNLANSIQGRVSGLNVTMPSGTPGAGLLINVRGYNNPLYVVDGIPLLSESNSALSTAFDLSGKPTGSGQTLSSVSDINPNDIQSIEVLKDASAAAIYGARAANGVILITTKRGQVGKPETHFNFYTGLQQLARPIKFMSSAQFRELIEEARANDLALYNADKNVFGADFDPSVLTDPLAAFDVASSPNTNWLDEVTRVAPISNYELAFKGGNNSTRYYTSAGYFDQTGIVIENAFKRFNYRLNLDHQQTDRLSFGANLSTTFSRNRRSFNDDTYSGIITNALGASPFMPVYEDDGTYANYENYEASWLSDNPVKSAKEIRAYTNSYRLLGTVYGQYQITPNINFKSSWSADGSFLFDRQFKSALTVDAQTVGGEAFEASFRNLTWLNENTLNYVRNFDKHSLNVLGGVSLQETYIDRSSALGQGFPSGKLERLSSAAAVVSASSVGTSFGLVSYIGRVNYAYADKYLLTASIRTDGSSRFSKNNRYGSFPSAAVAWTLSKEPFFKSFKKYLTDFKIRLSYGLTGDQEIGDFQNITFYTASRYAGQSGLQIRNIADPSLSWQQNRMLNVGFDFEVLDGRFNGSFDVFDSRKDRLLSEDVVAGTTGFSTVTRNSGEVQNLGAEFNLNASIIRNARLRWDVNFNATFVRNQIKSLSNDEVTLNAYNDLEATHILKVGKPIGSFIGLKYLGVNSDNGDALFQDTNNDGVVDFDDAVILGHALPNYFGGLTNNFKYRDFDLSIFLRFSGGNQVYNLIRSTTENLGWSNDGGLSSVYANNTLAVLDRWRKKGDKAEYPRASFVNPNFNVNSSQFVEDGSFMRLQNLSLGYTFERERKVVDNSKPEKLWSARIYFTAQNLFLISKYKGFDPEVSSNGGLLERTAGVDYAAYPQARVLMLGANVKF
jgi:TonB-linked SusC/RagA family outer membrane protein